MDKISDSVKSVQGESLSFFKYVFNFDDQNKNHLLNMIQYALLTIIPVLVVLRGIKRFVPEEDESKGSLEILFESVVQVLMLILGIWFINKIIRFIPTYSGEEYPKFNEVNFLIPFLLILATMQTKLGAKFNILIDRAMELVGMKEEKPSAPAQGQGQAQGKNVVRVSQPFAGQHQPSQADYLDRNQLLPQNGQLTAMPTQQPSQQGAMHDAMYQQQMSPEPLAANDGGGGWGSW